MNTNPNRDDRQFPPTTQTDAELHAIYAKAKWQAALMVADQLAGNGEMLVSRLEGVCLDDPQATASLVLALSEVAANLAHAVATTDGLEPGYELGKVIRSARLDHLAAAGAVDLDADLGALLDEG